MTSIMTGEIRDALREGAIVGGGSALPWGPAVSQIASRLKSGMKPPSVRVTNLAVKFHRHP